MICTLLTVALLGQAITKSGYVETLSYPTDPRVQRLPRLEKVWFSKTYSREDTLLGDELVASRVVGANGEWRAYPAAGYIQPLMKQISWQGRLKEQVANLLGEQRTVRREVVAGQQTWLYAWHQPEMRAGDVGSPATDYAYWIRADKNLPIIMRAEIGSGRREEVKALRLNQPVADSLFTKPTNLQEIKPFSCGSTYRVVISRSYIVEGVAQWETESTFEATGDHAAWSERNSSGAVTSKELSSADGRQQVFNYLAAPSFESLKRTKANEPMFGLTADCLVDLHPDTPVTYWVATHPSFGTITLRKDTKDHLGIHRTEVKSL